MIIPILSELDIIKSRQAGRALAKKLGFGVADQTRLATAISEITRNVVLYAGSGECSINDASSGKDIRIEVEITDDGPGIDDLKNAMTDSFSTGGGLGMGLPGTKRLVTDFQIESRPGATKVRFAIQRRTAS